MLDKLRSICVKLRTWGLAGVVNYARGARFRRQMQSIFRRNARAHRSEPQLFGYTLIDAFTQTSSHGKVMRDFAYALKEAGIPFQAFNVDQHPAISPDTLSGILTPEGDFNIGRYDHIVSISADIVPDSLRANLCRLAFWEFESGFLSAYPDLSTCPTVIAMSDFNARYFRSALPPSVRVQKILYPFRSSPCSEDECRAVRTKYGLRPDEFMVFFNFDFGSSYYRKNPEGVLKAFALAFRDTANTRLVFKTMRSSSRPDLTQKLTSLAKELNIADRLVHITDFLPEREIFALTGACDCYISLHRGEGFGITLAEAMSMGRPVICTDYSSTTEFCHPDCTLPVPYALVPVPKDQIDHPCYRDVTTWAEPDVNAAAAALRKLYDSPELRTELGNRAKESITRQFAVEEFRKSILP